MKVRWKIGLAAIGAALVVVCAYVAFQFYVDTEASGSAAPERVAATPPPQGRITQPKPGLTDADHARVNAASDFIHAYESSFGKSLASIRSVGKVEEETVNEVPNRHESEKTDEERTLVFHGLVLSVIVPHKDPKFALIEKIKVTSPDWELPNGLRVGSEVGALFRALGEPKFKDSPYLEYCGDTSCVVFHVDKDRVWKVVFNLYVD